MTIRFKIFAGLWLLAAVLLLVAACSISPTKKGVAGAEAPGDSEPVKIAQASGAQCGVELWAIKTLTDPAASQVNLTPSVTSIATIDALTAPADGSVRTAGGQIGGVPYELGTWTVTATLTGYKVEADSDLHLILSDGTKTMIAEIPDPGCAAGSRVLQQIADARAAFSTADPIAKACFGCLNQQVTITGVGFFDRLHGQVGVAANGAELHPVIAFAVGGTPAPTPTTPTTTTTPTPTPTPKPGKTGCAKYPERHWYHGIYHRICEPYYYTTP